MVVSLPTHRFSYWTDPNSDLTPVLIIGAGLSSGLAPRPDQLVKELHPKQVDIENTLGISTSFPLNICDPGSLYQWADHCISALTKSMSELDAKRRFVQASGLLTDLRFAGRANIPLRGTTPRHRVLARLAREGCMESVWSTNWDLWLEAAFESVGMECVRKISRIDGAFPETWKTRYEAWVPPAAPQCGKQTLTLFKPHGCISALHEGSPLFLITESELEKPLADQDPQCVERMKGDLKDRDACVIGWSASEEYLQDIFAELKTANLLSKSLAIIDPFPKVDLSKIKGDAHLRLADAYGQKITDVVCQVEPYGFGNTDDLMLWIQLQRGLNVLIKVCGDDNDALALLKSHLAAIESPLPREHTLQWVSSWFDSFLPVWLRLCFNCHAQTFFSGTAIPTNLLPIRLRDAHIPWGDIGLLRRDLKAATSIYRYVDQAHTIDPDLIRWDFETYPGALWNDDAQHLLMPVPIWCDLDHISLAVLKPLIDSHHWNAKGRIRKLSVAPIQCDSQALGETEKADRLSRWKEELASLMPHAAFATVSAIYTASIND